MHFLDVINVGKAEIFHWIGYPGNIPDANFDNTCGIRLELGVAGRWFPQFRPLSRQENTKNRAIETRQRKLSHWLVRQLGRPENTAAGRPRRLGSAHRTAPSPSSNSTTSLTIRGTSTLSCPTDGATSAAGMKTKTVRSIRVVGMPWKLGFGLCVNDRRRFGCRLAHGVTSAGPQWGCW